MPDRIVRACPYEGTITETTLFEGTVVARGQTHAGEGLVDTSLAVSARLRIARGYAPGEVVGHCGPAGDNRPEADVEFHVRGDAEFADLFRPGTEVVMALRTAQDDHVLDCRQELAVQRAACEIALLADGGGPLSADVIADLIKRHVGGTL